MPKKTLVTTEAQLITALQAGDSQAVTTWFQTYQARLTAYISRRVSNPADVEELVQEVFINCLKNIAHFKGKSSFYTWMCAIANHEVADYWRKRYAKKFIHALPLADFLLGANSTPDEQLVIEDAHQTAEHLEAVFKQIKAEYRELLLLKYVDQKKVKEISDLTGRSVKAIESDLFRARRDFKNAYQELQAAGQI